MIKKNMKAHPEYLRMAQSSKSVLQQNHTWIGQHNGWLTGDV